MVKIKVALFATAVPGFALEISTGIVMLQMRTELAVAQQQEHTMRSIIAIVLPIIAALGTSGLMFSATLA